MYDLCVIGGGAAGMSCAITAARLGLKVVLVEKNNKLGKKLYATGNGKCNLTNQYINISECYNSKSNDYIEFVNNAFGKNPTQNIISFVNSVGIDTMDINGYVYPKSAQASSFVWALIDELNNLNVKILLNKEIKSITTKSTHFKIKSQNEEITASQVVLATGGMSYKNLGGTDSGYKLSGNLGHSLSTIRPSLCGVKTNINLEDIVGVRANATATLIGADTGVLSQQSGELQITKNGLSGIMIFNLSSLVGAIISREKVYISLDFANDITKETYADLCNASSNRTVVGFLNGMINDKLASFICKNLNIDAKSKVSHISSEKLDSIYELMKNFRFPITGLMDYDSAQVCAGGITLSEIDSKTFMSNIIDGLYITGELLDIDGICGGYNLTFAILSGIVAGRGAYDKSKSN